MSVAANTQIREGRCAIIEDHAMVFTSAEEKFNSLAAEWLDSQSGRSRVDFLHPAHLQIIGMGPSAIPLLLREIQARTGFWFHAIRSITGVTPVSSQDHGRYEAVRRAWLRWASENGYGELEDGVGALDDIPF